MRRVRITQASDYDLVGEVAERRRGCPCPRRQRHARAARGRAQEQRRPPRAPHRSRELADRRSRYCELPGLAAAPDLRARAVEALLAADLVPDRRIESAYRCAVQRRDRSGPSRSRPEPGRSESRRLRRVDPAIPRSFALEPRVDAERRSVRRDVGLAGGGSGSVGEKAASHGNRRECAAASGAAARSASARREVASQRAARPTLGVAGLFSDEI